MNFGFIKNIASKENIGLTIGIVGYSTVHSLIGRVIPQMQIGPINSTQIAEIVGGAFLAKKSGIVGGIGKALIVINLASIVNGFMQGGLSNLLGANTAQSNVGVYANDL